MTRATDKVLRRIVDGSSLGPIVMEVTARTLRLRPLGTRNRNAIVEYPWGALYKDQRWLVHKAARVRRFERMVLESRARKARERDARRIQQPPTGGVA